VRFSLFPCFPRNSINPSPSFSTTVSSASPTSLRRLARRSSMPVPTVSLAVPTPPLFPRSKKGRRCVLTLGCSRNRRNRSARSQYFSRRLRAEGIGKGGRERTVRGALPSLARCLSSPSPLLRRVEASGIGRIRRCVGSSHSQHMSTLLSFLDATFDIFRLPFSRSSSPVPFRAVLSLALPPLTT
jgi:hypothetical protein